MAEGSRTFRGAGEENERREDERQDQPATRAPPHRRPVARGTLAPWSKRARQLRRDEAILFILSAPLGIEPRSPRPQRGIRAPRDQDQGPSTRRFSQARARVANLPPGVRTTRRGDSRSPRAAIADGRPTTPPRDPLGATRPPRPTSPTMGRASSDSSSDSNSSSSSSTSRDRKARKRKKERKHKRKSKKERRSDKKRERDAVDDDQRYARARLRTPGRSSVAQPRTSETTEHA